MSTRLLTGRWQRITRQPTLVDGCTREEDECENTDEGDDAEQPLLEGDASVRHADSVVLVVQDGEVFGE